MERNGAHVGLVVVTILLALAGAICLIVSVSRHSGPVDHFGPPVGYTVMYVGVGLLAFALLSLLLTLMTFALTRPSVSASSVA